jgi:hypothetical protein
LREPWEHPPKPAHPGESRVPGRKRLR